jgi:hypothetical protein
MNYTEIVKKYNRHGIECLPTKIDKSPALSSNWKEGFDLSVFSDCYGIGIIAGKKSNGIECFDFDNHAREAKINLTAFLSIPEVKEIYEKYKLPVEKTFSGGFHLLFRCDKIEGNRKLASKLLNGKPDCFIETRGEGGYFCAAPTPKYEIVRNDIHDIQTITPIERAILIDNAVSMNEFYPPLTKTEYEQTDRPGDLYNSSVDSIGEMKSLLGGAGWKDLGGTRWRRPGKKEGISATLGKVAPNVFYCFTASGYPFEPMKGYTPFQVLGLIKYGGDFKEAAKSIAPEKQVIQKQSAIQSSEIEKILNNALIDTRKRIERPPTILSVIDRNGTSLEQKRVFTLGNFSCFIGKAKSKKTFAISLVTAALLRNSRDEKFISEMPVRKDGILYFDTEQGEYDSYNVIRRIEKMAGTGLRLKGYNLRPFSPVERCQIIEYAFKLFGNETGYCVIDGIADLANGINDEEEATRVTTILLRLSKVYNCHISTVIHQNKNDNFATGHLGSSIMKKAEIIISVTKRESNISEIGCDMSRGISFDGFDMKINNEGIPEVNGITQKKKEPASYYDTEKQDPLTQNTEFSTDPADKLKF